MAAAGRSLQEFSKVVTYDDLNMIIKSVLEGDGVAYLARHVVQEYLSDGRLVVYPVPGFEQPLFRSLVVGPDYVPTPVSDDLIRIIREFSS